MKDFPQNKAQKEAHARRLGILRQKGWTGGGNFWVSPHTGTTYTESVAICVEELRGTFRQGYKTRD